MRRGIEPSEQLGTGRGGGHCVSVTFQGAPQYTAQRTIVLAYRNPGHTLHRTGCVSVGRRRSVGPVLDLHSGAAAVDGQVRQAVGAGRDVAS
ncbi:hypothetical protein GCM10009804_64590 [Kribbella hippodromi]|uniref:Uncharacterized protein n=1 Tax=Kribbella hippodromi TaxID=434347 RepID=A0ABN2E9G6_9ACTN